MGEVVRKDRFGSLMKHIMTTTMRAFIATNSIGPQQYWSEDSKVVVWSEQKLMFMWNEEIIRLKLKEE